MSENCMVSVYCLAYNHERYIEQALHGFVIQKTNFKYKVYIHDDASTDKTRAVIEQYAKEYPDIIFPIYQKENQYSKEGRIFQRFIAPLMNSKYIACCEGDDYWMDENKLQMQYDYMESHPKCTLCVHNTNVINVEDDSKNRLINTLNQDCDYNTEQVMQAGGSGLFHTSSFFYKRDDRLAMPESLTIRGMGDFTLSLFLAQKGYVHYIGRIMSCYRSCVPGSWSKRTSSTDARCNHINKVIEWLNEFDAFTGHRYSTAVKENIRKKKYQIYRLKGKCLNILLNTDTRAFFRKQSTAEKIKVIILALCPWASKLKTILKKKV